MTTIQSLISGTRARVATLALVTAATLGVPLLSGCAADGRARAMAEPSSAPVVPVRSSRPVVALALGSGGARGFAHVGVIKALESAGIRPDIVVGTSSGSVVAALYAGGYDAARLEQVALELEESDLVDLSLFSGMRVRGELLAQFVRERLDYRPMEQLDRVFAVVATDAETGALTVFNRGDSGLAVRASSAVPRMFVPPVIGGREYVDGGLASPVPVKLARAMGADVVIAVDVSRLGAAATAARPVAGAPSASPYTRGSRRVLLDAELAAADVVIRPDVPRTRMLDFDRKRESIEAGEAAARVVLGELGEILARAARAPR